MNPETQQQAPTKPQDSPDYLFLPGHLFFCAYVQVPPGLSDEELEEFAEMTMGSLSPFPLEYIHWGWFKEPDQPWLLLYSATKDSIYRAGYKDIEDYQHVFPSFLSTLAFKFAEPTIYFSYHPQTQTLTFHMHPGQQSLTPPADETKADKEGDTEEKEDDDDWDDDSILMPDIKLPAIHSVNVPSHDPDMDHDFIEEEEDEYEQREPDAPNYEDISDIRDSILNQLPSTDEYHIEDHWLVHATTTLNKDRTLHLDNNWSDPVSTQPGPNTELSRTQLWQADVRGVEFKTQERQTRKQERLLAIALKVAVIAILVFVIFEFGAIFGGNWTQNLKDQVAANDPKVARVTEKSILRDTIDGISTNNLQPFRMLQVLNNYRTGGIYFKKVEAAEGNKMEVRGEAKRGSEVNAFKNMLLESGEVLSCEVDMTIRGGIATFTLDLVFPNYEAPTNEPEVSIPAPLAPTTPSPIPSTPPNAPGQPPNQPKMNIPSPPLPPGFPIPSATPNPSTTPSTPPKRPSSPPPPPPTKPPSLPPGIPTTPIQNNKTPAKPGPDSSSATPKTAPKPSTPSANPGKPSTPPTTTTPKTKPSTLPPGIPATPTNKTPPQPKTPPSSLKTEKKSSTSDPLQFPTGKPPSTKAPSSLPPGIPPPPPLPQK